MSRVPRRAGVVGIQPAGLVGSGSRLWTPADIPGLTAWWDADVGVGLTSGKVSSWAPAAGAGGMSAQQPNSAQQPSVTQQDGFTTIAFGGVGANLNITPAAQMPSMLLDFTMMAAFVQPDNSTSMGLFQWGGDGDNSGAVGYSPANAGVQSYYKKLTWRPVSATTPNLSSWQFLFGSGSPPQGAGSTSGKYIGRLNGEMFAIDSAIIVGQRNGGAATIGARNSDFGNTPIRVAALAIVRASSCPGDEIVKWEGYYAAKMNALGILPATHPYKSTPPRL